MGFFDILFGLALISDMSKKKENRTSDSSFGIFNQSSNNDTWHDREFDNECDCGYCSDHEDNGWW
jgi:hypothetical protein